MKRTVLALALVLALTGDLNSTPGQATAGRSDASCLDGCTPEPALLKDPYYPETSGVGWMIWYCNDGTTYRARIVFN